MAEHYDVVVPLINRTCVLGTKVPIPLGASSAVQTIRANDLATISANVPSSRDMVTGNSKVILWSRLPAMPSEVELQGFLLKSVFALNFLSESSSASVGVAYMLRQSRKTHYQGRVEVGGYNHNFSSGFTIPKSANHGEAALVYEASDKGISADKSLKISISRFCSAVAKPSIADKVIDIAICLESIFTFSTEISFRFSLYNSLLASGLTDREEVFRSLKKLYDIRSKIVHGSSEGDEAWFEANWDRIVKIAKISLLKKMEFLKDRSKDEWQAYLDKLCLGLNI